MACKGRALDGEQQKRAGGEGPKPLGGDRGSAGRHSLQSFPGQAISHWVPFRRVLTAQASCAPRARSTHVSFPCVVSELLDTVCTPTCRIRPSAVDGVWFGAFGLVPVCSQDGRVLVDSCRPHHTHLGSWYTAQYIVHSRAAIRWRLCVNHTLQPPTHSCARANSLCKFD